MTRTRRTTWLKVTALVAAIASLTINFGLIDLVDGFTGYVDQARNQVLDVGWGAVFGVILPLGLLSQLRAPERRIAGIQQTVVVASMLALAAAAAFPALVYAWRMASAARRDLPPADAVSNGLHHWTVMTALGLLVLALVLLAALRPRGWRIPAKSASIAAAGWAISCLLAPELPAGSEGQPWALAVIVWALATRAATNWPRTRDRRVS